MGVAQVFNVKDYGAIGNQSADDTAAIQAAIAACPGRGSTVFFPRGVYRTTGPINIIDNVANGSKRGINVTGENGGASGGSDQCAIFYDGAAVGPIVNCLSRDNVFRNLGFSVANGRTASAAVKIDQEDTHLSACTNIAFEQCRFSINAGGTLQYGVTIGGSEVGNTEYMRFTRCYFMSHSLSGVKILSTTGQSKANTFYSCAFMGGEHGIETVTGSFSSYGCDFGSTTGAAILLGSVTDSINITDSDSESCARFLETAGGTASHWAVRLLGGRLTMLSIHADGRYIKFTDGGPLIIQNVLFSNDGRGNFKIYAHSANPGCKLVSIGNIFPRMDPYEMTASERVRIVSLGNGMEAPGPVRATLPDMIYNGSDTLGEGFQMRVPFGFGAAVLPTQPLGTAATGTGVTVNATGDVRRITHKVTMTQAAFAAAALTADKTIYTLAAKQKLVAIYAEVTTPFTGGGVTAASLTVGKTAGGAEYLVSFDVLSAVIARGLADADLGTALNRASAIQGGDLPSLTGTTAITARLTTVSANTNLLTAGSITFTLQLEML